MEDLQKKKQLWKMVPIASSRINPYRIIILLRLLILAFFLRHRVITPTMDESYLFWLISLIRDIWFAFSWILDLSQKCFPVLHETSLPNLSLRFESDRKHASKLAPIDLFVSSVDPLKEPPIITANTVLSILSVDYPTDKVSCYVSDDGASMLLFNTLLQTSEFAKKWVPFCKKYCIEPRAPEFYFAQKTDYVSNKMKSSFFKERNFIQRDYEEFKVKINALVAMEMANPSNKEVYLMKDGTPWPGKITQDHPSMIEVILGRGLDLEGNVLPKLIYISREKRPGYDHYKKAGAMNALVRASAVLSNAPFILNLDCDHYINNSKALREAMCFHMDSQLGNKLCFVQFPQRFYGVDTGDRYANHNNVFFDSNLKGLDGIQGPMYIGTGCVFNRRALYGYDPPMSDKHKNMALFDYMCSSWVFCWCKSGKRKNYGLKKRFGSSEKLVSSTHMEDGSTGVPGDLVKEAITVINCDYEENTEWGEEIGWIYGSVTEDILTGFKMHCRGWKSVYYIPKRDAFKGTAPINLSDRLHQVLRWSLGSVEIFMSRHSPVWYGWGGGKLKLLQRLAYINITTYPFSSIPLLAYCMFPSIRLLTGNLITGSKEMNTSNIWFLALFLSIVATIILEARWSDVSIKDFWCVERFWMICGVSAYIFAVVQGLLKVIFGIETKFTVTSKTMIEDDKKDDEFRDLYILKWTMLLILPTILSVLNIAGVVIGISEAMNNGFGSWDFLLGRLFIPIWVILHLYPFMKGLMGRNNITIIIFGSCAFLIFIMKDYNQT